MGRKLYDILKELSKKHRVPLSDLNIHYAYGEVQVQQYFNGHYEYLETIFDVNEEK